MNEIVEMYYNDLKLNLALYGLMDDRELALMQLAIEAFAEFYHEWMENRSSLYR